MEKDLEIIKLDEKDLSGTAKISINKSLTDRTELGAIREACREYSKQSSHLKMEQDGSPVSVEKKFDASGKETSEIIFGFELKTNNN